MEPDAKEFGGSDPDGWDPGGFDDAAKKSRLADTIQEGSDQIP